MQDLPSAGISPINVWPLKERWDMCSQSLCDGVCVQGKGANTPFILESRGLQRSETMSSLLERNPDIRDLMNQGELVPDTMVRPPCSHHVRGSACLAACASFGGVLQASHCVVTSSPLPATKREHGSIEQLVPRKIVLQWRLCAGARGPHSCSRCRVNRLP